MAHATHAAVGRRSVGHATPQEPGGALCCDNVTHLCTFEGRHVMELDQSYVWISTRRLKPGKREEFSRAWRPRGFPEGMLRAYECYAPDGNEVVGISIWDSPESRERFRLSEVETERRQAMAPFVLEESSGFYVGRELKIPER